MKEIISNSLQYSENTKFLKFLKYFWNIFAESPIWRIHFHLPKVRFKRRRNTQHHDIQHNNIQHNGHYCAHKSFKYSSIQVVFCYASSVILIVTFLVILSFVMLNVRALFISLLKVRLHWQSLLQKRNQKRQFHILMSPSLSQALSPTKLDQMWTLFQSSSRKIICQ